jgi:hypothetical protein
VIPSLLGMCRVLVTEKFLAHLANRSRPESGDLLTRIGTTLIIVKSAI